MPVYSLIYLSEAVRTWSQVELRELLEKSRTKNGARQITGLLLLKDNQFMQLLEGPEAAVKALYARIQADPRHRAVTLLLDETRPARQFPDWSMSFVDLSPGFNLPGYREFASRPLTRDEFVTSPSDSLRLLSLFSEPVADRPN